MLTRYERAIILREGAKKHLQGRVSFSPEPTDAQYRFLLFVLAHHGPETTDFRATPIPVEFVFWPLLAAAPDKALDVAVRGLFGYPSPVLRVEEVDAAGDKVKNGSFCVMPLLCQLDYTLGHRHVLGCMNNAVLRYLPQLVALLPPELLEGLPLAHRPRRLAF